MHLYSRAQSIFRERERSETCSTNDKLKMEVWDRIVVVVVSAILLAICASGFQFQVGGSLGWKPFVNYTQWSTHQRFHLGDCLYFTYDKAAYKVKEVSKEDYESCLSSEAVRNLTGSNGRGEVELSEARHYYFVTGFGYCFLGMKLSVLVEHNPIDVQAPAALQAPAPHPTPVTTHNGGSPSSPTLISWIVFSTFLTAAVFNVLNQTP